MIGVRLAVSCAAACVQNYSMFGFGAGYLSFDDVEVLRSSPVSWRDAGEFDVRIECDTPAATGQEDQDQGHQKGEAHCWIMCLI